MAAGVKPNCLKLWHGTKDTAP